MYEVGMKQIFLQFSTSVPPDNHISTSASPIAYDGYNQPPNYRSLDPEFLHYLM
jgi:hypothetical protein